MKIILSILLLCAVAHAGLFSSSVTSSAFLLKESLTVSVLSDSTKVGTTDSLMYAYLMDVRDAFTLFRGTSTSTGDSVKLSMQVLAWYEVVAGTAPKDTVWIYPVPFKAPPDSNVGGGVTNRKCLTQPADTSRIRIILTAALTPVLGKYTFKYDENVIPPSYLYARMYRQQAGGTIRTYIKVWIWQER